MSVRVTCITKDGGNHNNPHEGITNYGWRNEHTGSTGNSTRAQMIKYLQDDNKAYVKDSHGHVAYIGIWTSAYGNKYLRTYADGEWNDNLLALPEC